MEYDFTELFNAIENLGFSVNGNLVIDGDIEVQIDEEIIIEIG